MPSPIKCDFNFGMNLLIDFRLLSEWCFVWFFQSSTRITDIISSWGFWMLGSELSGLVRDGFLDWGFVVMENFDRVERWAWWFTQKLVGDFCWEREGKSEVVDASIVGFGMNFWKIFDYFEVDWLGDLWLDWGWGEG